LSVKSYALAASAGADLGFYKGGYPIHLKGAPEVERERRRGGWKIFAFLYQMVSFRAFPVIFIDTVTFKKGALIKRAGVRTPETPWIRP